jgi:mycothiol synthase
VAVDVGLEALIRKDGKIIAASFNEDAVLYNKEHGTKIGWVWVLGVDKNYRRAGLGTAMLIDGIRWLFSRGLDTALLYVDAENRRALGLYTSIGFEVVNESVIYRVDL